MAVYSVHMRPISEHPNPDEFVFVRDGFSLWAFLFGPFWMLRHRLWLVLLIYLAVVIALAAALHFLGASPGAKVAAGFLLCFLVGFEAATLRRFGLARRGSNELGIVVSRCTAIATMPANKSRLTRLRRIISRTARV